MFERRQTILFLPSINFAKDMAESISYVGAIGAGSTVGLSECNNLIKQTTFLSTLGYGDAGQNFNAGRAQSMISTSYDPVNSPIGSTNSNLTSSTVMKSVAKNYFNQNGNTDNVHYILATFSLKHPSRYIEKATAY